MRGGFAGPQVAAGPHQDRYSRRGNTWCARQQLSLLLLHSGPWVRSPTPVQNHPTPLRKRPKPPRMRPTEIGSCAGAWPLPEAGLAPTENATRNANGTSFSGNPVKTSATLKCGECKRGHPETRPKFSSWHESRPPLPKGACAGRNPKAKCRCSPFEGVHRAQEDFCFGCSLRRGRLGRSCLCGLGRNGSGVARGREQSRPGCLPVDRGSDRHPPRSRPGLPHAAPVGRHTPPVPGGPQP